MNIEYMHIAIFALGILIGWLSKAPWFLREYKKWEEENKRIKKWMEKH